MPKLSFYGATGTVTATYSTSDATAAAGQDYAPASGSIEFAAGETRKTVSIGIVDDGDEEGDETFTVTLAIAGGDAELGAPATCTVTIADDETLRPKSRKKTGCRAGSLARAGATPAWTLLAAASGLLWAASRRR